MLNTLSIVDLEAQLKKSWAFGYHWGKKQNNHDDRLTDFIYTTPWFNEMVIMLSGYDTALQQYALARWYNFWSAKGVEAIFAQHAGVSRTSNPKDTQKDFFWNGIPFDHKTTVFPKGFAKGFEYAKAHPHELIDWLYAHQSQEKRLHWKNRWFVVVYDSKEHQHWKCKAELTALHTIIHRSLKNFQLSDCYCFLHNGVRVYSTVLWAIF